jgi:hypothetical protein
MRPTVFFFFGSIQLSLSFCCLFSAVGITPITHTPTVRPRTDDDRSSPAHSRRHKAVPSLRTRSASIFVFETAMAQERRRTHLQSVRGAEAQRDDHRQAPEMGNLRGQQGRSKSQGSEATGGGTCAQSSQGNHVRE